jgi:hypothetical protein
VAAVSRTVQPTHGFADGPVDGLIVETLREAVQDRKVRHYRQPQPLTLFAVLAQTHFGFAKRPVLTAHQSENG